nr:LysR family transcriptional regulator [uncultured Holophaga sp.]
MEIRQLRCFMAVAEHLNFTKAASKVFITQSAISYQIAELERQLDVKLFIRDKHSVRLTPAGELFCRDVQRILAELDEAVDRVHKAKSGVLGRLSLGILASEKFLPEVLKRFSSAHPDITVNLTRYSLDDLHAALQNREVDIGLTLSVGLPDMPHCGIKVLSADVLSVAMRRDHPLAGRERLWLTDLKEVPMILPARESTSVMSRWFEGACERRGFSPKVVRRTSDVETILLQVESGLGVSCLARTRAELYAQFDLKCVDLADPEMAIDSLVVWRNDTDNPAIPLFLQALQA